MTDHLKRLKEMAGKLAAIGSPIATEDQVVTLLASSPDSYSTIVTVLEAHVDDLSVSFLQQALLNEEKKQDETKLLLRRKQRITLLWYAHRGINVTTVE